MNHPDLPLVEKTPEQSDAGERCSVAPGSAVSRHEKRTAARLRVLRAVEAGARTPAAVANRLGISYSKAFGYMTELGCRPLWLTPAEQAVFHPCNHA